MNKLAAAALLVRVSLAAAEITGSNLRLLEYPGFPEAHSTWGSIGYSAVHNKVFVVATNHRDRQGLYEYDVASGTLNLCGFIDEMLHLRDFQWQGKVHTQLVEGPGGEMYFATDGGENRQLYLMDHPQGYSGGFFLKWDSGRKQLTNLGMGLQYESLKDLAVDRRNGRILAVTFPQAHLLAYDARLNRMQDLGRMGSGHVPRVIFRDWWDNIYYVDWRQRLVKYEHDSGKLIFARESLPAFEGTPGNSIITGITAYACDREAGVIYLITYGSKMLAFRPQRDGIGKVEDLGGIYDGVVKKPYQYYCPNLALGRNGKLYYFLGGHGIYAGAKPSVAFVEFTPATRTKRVLVTYPLTTLSEATGSDIRDAQGNLYFAGRRFDASAYERGESGASKPILVIFNPEKELR
jgi:hypothetical protein